MKIRSGFVSNSSSTSFLMMFNSKGLEDVKEGFLKLLEKYKHYFDLFYIDCSGASRQTSGDEVFAEIAIYVRKMSTTVFKIDELIERLESEIENCEKEIAGGEYRSWDDYNFERIRDLHMRIFDLKELKEKRGFDSYITMDFGDSDGDVSGGTMGVVMDYEGRYVRISKEDFFLYTEQNR